MNSTPERFAYRCLPLLIANQAGWLVLNTLPVRVTWDGSDALEGITIEALGDRPPSVRSHFGGGILTWNLPYVFRTSPGFNLLVRGPSNWPKDGVYPLEGIVETDWSPATFTMNWKLTRPQLPVVFERDEPICMILPQRRGELEDIRPALRSLIQAPAVAFAYARWSHSRSQFLEHLKQPGSDAQKRGWQRDYLLGVLPDGTQAAGHQTKLDLRPFDADATDGNRSTPGGAEAPDAPRRKDLLLLPDFITPENCQKLVTAYEEGLASGRVTARGTMVRDLSLSLFVAHDRELNEWAKGVRDAVCDLLARHFGLPGLFADYTAFKCEYEGGAHPLHADNVTASGEPNHTYWREATAMLYLNEGERDFHGGRIRFARLNQEVVPKPGLLVGFGCGLDFEHEVTPVLVGKRYGIAFWFTRDPRRRENW